MKHWIILFLILSSPLFAIVGPPITISKGLPKQSCLILYYGDNKETVKSLCSGTLISNNKILTAAHCEENHSKTPTKILCNHKKESRWVSKRYIHPEYVTAGQGNDLALLEVDTKFNITPIRIANTQEEIEKFISQNSCFIFGYGLDEEDNAGTLKGTKAQFMNIKVGKHMVALGTNRYARQGDSGGGLNCIDDDNKWIRIGTISRATPGISISEYLTPNLDWLMYLLPKLRVSESKKTVLKRYNYLEKTRRTKLSICIEKYEKLTHDFNHGIETHFTLKDTYTSLSELRVITQIKKRHISLCKGKIQDYLRPKVGNTYLVSSYTWLPISIEESKTVGERTDIIIKITKIREDEYGEMTIEGTIFVPSGEKALGTQIPEGVYKNIIVSNRSLARKL